jgi:hypothetical protein
VLPGSDVGWLAAEKSCAMGWVALGQDYIKEMCGEEGTTTVPTRTTAQGTTWFASVSAVSGQRRTI